MIPHRAVGEEDANGFSGPGQSLLIVSPVPVLLWTLWTSSLAGCGVRARLQFSQVAPQPYLYINRRPPASSLFVCEIICDIFSSAPLPSAILRLREASRRPSAASRSSLSTSVSRDATPF
jgi:hypothetical protein